MMLGVDTLVSKDGSSSRDMSSVEGDDAADRGDDGGDDDFNEGLRPTGWVVSFVRATLVGGPVWIVRAVWVG